MKKLIVALIFSQQVFANVTVQSEWVMTTRSEHRFSMQPHERTQPLVVGDILYFANLRGELFAVHRKMGYQLWKHKMPGPVSGALSYGRSKLFVGDTQGNLTALSARNGEEIWKYQAKAEWLSPPAVMRDRIFIADSAEDLYAFDINSGKELWHYSHRGDEKMTIRGTGGPAVFAGEVFQGFADGSLVALSSQRGEELWVKRLRSRERFYDVDMKPYVDKDSVVAATFDGKLYRLNRLTGETQWVFPVGSHSGFLVEERKIYFAGLNGNFYALDLDSGQVIWKTSFGKGVGLAPTRAGEYLAFATSSDPMYVIDPKNGEIIWQGSLGAGTFAPPGSESDGWFYCLSNYGNLFSFRVQPRVGNLTEMETLSLPMAVERAL